jgi:hypothetical protein
MEAEQNKPLTLQGGPFDGAVYENPGAGCGQAFPVEGHANRWAFYVSDDCGRGIFKGIVERFSGGPFDGAFVDRDARFSAYACPADGDSQLVHYYRRCADGQIVYSGTEATVGRTTLGGQELERR